MSPVRQVHDKASAIEQSPWFAYLPEEGLLFLKQHSHLRKVVSGQRIISRSAPNNSVFGLVSGRIRMGESSATGQEFNMIDLFPGAWFGDYSLHGDVTSPLDGNATEDSSLVVISYPVLHEAASQWPGLYRGFHRDLLKRTRPLFDLVELLSAHSLSVRLAIRLLVLFRDYGKPVAKDRGRFSIKIKQSDLASLCCGTRQHVNRLLGAWCDEGFIHVRGSVICCGDFNRLIAKAKESGFSGT